MPTTNSSLLNSDVILLSHDEYQQTMRDVLEKSGYTLEELRQQAELEEFVTERARLTWLMVKD